MTDDDAHEWLAKQAIPIDWQNLTEGRASDLSRALGKKRTRQECLDKAVVLLQQCMEHDVMPGPKLFKLFQKATTPRDHERKDLQIDPVAFMEAGIGIVGNGPYAIEMLRELASYFSLQNLAMLPKHHSAAEYEADFDLDPSGKNPSIAPVAHVANHAGVDRKTIKNWRSLKTYCDLVQLLRLYPRKQFFGPSRPLMYSAPLWRKERLA